MSKRHYYDVLSQKPREIATDVLMQRERGADYVENLLENELALHRLSPADRGLCLELVYGAVRWQGTLDWLISRKTHGRTQKSLLQILLRLGLYQMFWLDRIPDHAAVHESVELAKLKGYGPQAGFVNAVLRGYARESAETEKLLAELRETTPHLGYSHPQWLCERWQSRWGAEKTTRLLEWNNTAPKTFARINTLRADAAKVLEQWRNEAVVYDFFRSDWAEDGLVFELKEHRPLAKLPSFERGFFYIQDPSTLLAVKMLDPQPGETILDLCAAPGGKTTYIAQLMNNQGRVVAQDNQSDRLPFIRENCQRLGVSCAHTELTPPGDPVAFTYDRVLVDAPCSNTGVMRRRVDLRWRIRPEEIERLGATQLELLHKSAKSLKPGGTLVYSTCSLEPEENAGVVEAFTRANPAFQLDQQRELIPFTDGVDGAFAAKWTRKG